MVRPARHDAEMCAFGPFAQNKSVRTVGFEDWSRGGLSVIVQFIMKYVLIFCKVDNLLVLYVII